VSITNIRKEPTVGIPLETKKPTFPAVKPPEPGTYVDLVIAHLSEVPWNEFNPDPNAPKRQRISKVTGKPQFQERIIGIVTGSKGVNIKDTDGRERPVATGDEVALYLGGQRRWTWIEAKKAHTGVSVGDRLRWKYERDEQGQGAEPKKIHSAILRAPKPEESGDVAAAEELYARIETGVTERTNLDNGGSYADDEEPF
jgi:hypothetical protein